MKSRNASLIVSLLIVLIVILASYYGYELYERYFGAVGMNRCGDCLGFSDNGRTIHVSVGETIGIELPSVVFADKVTITPIDGLHMESKTHDGPDNIIRRYKVLKTGTTTVSILGDNEKEQSYTLIFVASN